MAAAQRAFRLRIEATGVFPDVRSPRVLWIDVADERGSLAALNRGLEAVCENFGFSREKRKYTPHLTIGRLREPRRAADLAAAHLLAAEFAPVDFEVSEIVIYESVPEPRRGTSYRKLQSFPLAPAEGRVSTE
jgi:RNA 2',3'-cyclic 3'-phosphodiesterase